MSAQSERRSPRAAFLRGRGGVRLEDGAPRPGGMPPGDGGGPAGAPRPGGLPPGDGGGPDGAPRPGGMPHGDGGGPTRFRKSLVPILAVAIACCIAASLRRVGADAWAVVTGADLRFLLAAVGVCILYRLVNSTGWVFVLRALGHPMPLAQGARIWITAETMRWLPGSVWGFVSRVFQAEKAGASPAVAAASLPLELMLTIAAWGIAAAAGLAMSGVGAQWLGRVDAQVVAFGVGALVVLGVGIVACACLARRSTALRAASGDAPAPERQGALARKFSALRTQLRALSQLRPRVAPLALTLLLYTALCALNGFAFHLVLRAVSDAPLTLVAAIGANAAGWLAGFFAIGVPGGIGVREAASAAVLASVVPVETVVAAALLWRLVLIADELCCLGVLLVPAVGKRRPAQRCGGGSVPL